MVQTGAAEGIVSLFKTADLKGIAILPVDVGTEPVDVGTEPLYIGFSKADPKGKEAFDKFQAALAELEKLGELDKIRKKYMK